MLALTENAANVIRDIVEGSELSEQAGIRITADVDGSGVALQMSVSPAALDGDEVVEEHGAHVFLDPPAAAALSDKLLDAEADEDQVRFSIDDRAGAD